jgi:hypothetical protein
MEFQIYLFGQTIFEIILPGRFMPFSINLLNLGQTSRLLYMLACMRKTAINDIIDVTLS